jgi:hypothetical protein
MDVIIKDVCMSSCANYIFTAGNNKYLQPYSVLMWHGSSWQPNLDEKYKQGIELFVRWREKEVAFFDKIGVNYRITVYGIEHKYSFWQRFKAKVFKDIIDGFDYSIMDMEKFGITNIHVAGDKWNWRQHTNCCNITRIKVKKLPLK